MISGQGKMEETSGGAKRESNLHRGRFDLLPYEAMEALAIWYELGAEKYAPRNWEKGLSVSDCINRMTRHALKVCSGWTDEDHLAAVMWNAAGAITMMQRRPDLNDHAWHTSTEEDKFWREQEKELEEKYRFFLDHLPEDAIAPKIVKDISDNFTKKLEKEVVDFYGGDSEKPFMTLEREISSNNSWLDDIADLSEEDVEKIRLYSTSGIFTVNELRVIVRSLALRTAEMLERSQKAYDEIMKEMRNE